MAKPEPKRTRSQIVRGWFREESFWRDVTTRTVAGLIVLALGALAVGLVGILDIWVVLRVLFAIGTFLGTFMLFIIFANKVMAPVMEAGERRIQAGKVGWPLSLAGLVLAWLGIAGMVAIAATTMWLLGLWGAA
jgi:hypothetical protein